MGKISVNSDNETHIEVKSRILKIDIELIELVEFEYEGYYGEGKIYQWIFPKYQNYYFGTNNKIKITTPNGTNSHRIFLRNKKEKEKFFELVYFSLENSIRVKEWYRKKRSYGGRFLNYEEIQQFKKRYNIM